MRRPKSIALASVFAVVASTLAFAGVAVTTAPANAVTPNGAWSSIGVNTRPNNSVFDVVQTGAGTGDLYAVGLFTGANGQFVSKYTAGTNSWAPVTTSTFTGGRSAYAAALDGTNLYVGGRFGVENSGTPNTSATNIVRINTSSVGAANAIHHGLGDAGGAWDGVERLAVDGSGTLYAAGTFSGACTAASCGGTPTQYTQGLAKWNGTTWSALGHGLISGAQSNALLIDGTTTYIGGQFGGALQSDDTTVTSQYMLKWDGTNFSALGDLAVGGPNAFKGITSFLKPAHVTAPRTGNMWIGGGFQQTTAATPEVLNSVGRFDASAPATVSKQGSGLAYNWASGPDIGIIETMAEDAGGDIYIGGTFTSVNGVAATNIARFNGSAWEPLMCGSTNGLNDTVRKILPQIDGSLIIAGKFKDAGGDLRNDYIVRYTPGADNCTAAAPRPAGTTTTEPELTVPGPPQNVKSVYNESSNSVTVSWDPPASNGGTPVLGYNMEFANGSFDCWTPDLVCTIPASYVPDMTIKLPVVGTIRTNTDRARKEFLMMTAQLGGSQYGYGVQALNAVGWGDKAWVKEFDPNLPAVVTNPPRDLVATGGWNQVTVKLKEPLPVSTGWTYPVTNYMVIAKPGTKYCISTMMDADLKSCTFTDLQPGVDYTFQAQALSGAGWSDRSAVSNSATPRNLRITNFERKKVIIAMPGTSKIIITGKSPGFAPGTPIKSWFSIGNDGNWLPGNDATAKAGGKIEITRKFDSKWKRKPIAYKLSIGDRFSNTVVVPPL